MAAELCCQWRLSEVDDSPVRGEYRQGRACESRPTRGALPGMQRAATVGTGPYHLTDTHWQTLDLACQEPELAGKAADSTARGAMLFSKPLAPAEANGQSARHRVGLCAVTVQRRENNHRPGATREHILFAMGQRQLQRQSR